MRRQTSPTNSAGEAEIVEPRRIVRGETEVGAIPPRHAEYNQLWALGLQPVKFTVLSGGDAYLMAFTIGGPGPAPSQIQPCQD